MVFVSLGRNDVYPQQIFSQHSELSLTQSPDFYLWYWVLLYFPFNIYRLISLKYLGYKHVFLSFCISIGFRAVI